MRMTWGLVCAALLFTACDASQHRPKTQSVDPSTICTDRPWTFVTASGKHFVPAVSRASTTDPRLDLPTVSIRGALALGDLPAPDSSETDMEVTRWDTEGSLTFRVEQELELAFGVYDVAVTNPDGRSGILEAGIVLADRPVVTAASPAKVCEASTHTLVALSGEGYVIPEGTLPTARVGLEAVSVLQAQSCAPIGGNVDAQLCDELVIDIDATAFDRGAHAIEVTAAPPMDCVGPDEFRLQIIGEPVVTDATPPSVCELGGSFVVTGENFVEGTTVSFDGDVFETVEYVDDTSLVVTVPAGMATGHYDVWMVGPGGCEAEVPGGISIVPSPLVFAVDPPVVYNQVTISAQVFVAGINDVVTAVSLTPPSGGQSTPLDFTWNPSRPGQLTVVVPAGLTEGSYDLNIEQANGCGGSLEDALYVEADLTVAIDAVEPPFAWTYDATPVQLTADSPPPSGQTGFADTPRVFLNPQSSSGIAAPLLALTFQDPSLLTAVIPDLLTPGMYDVLVVNPDGSVGLLPSGLEILTDAPPTILSVSPGTLPNSANQTVTIRGREFRDPDVTLVCDEAGTQTTGTATVQTWTYAKIEASVPATSFGNQAVCIVEVTNDDGTFARFSAISITQPSQNLFPWRAGTDLVFPRRAPAAVAGRTTSVSRFVYAIGGDDGDIANPYDTVEVAPVDVYGNMGEWRLVTGRLLEPRTLAQAVVIGRFIYLVGGHNGTQPLQSVRRSLILDPLEVPRLDSLSVDYTGAVGLEPGSWTYRIAAIYDVADTVNPGGTSLPSEEIVVRLPDAAERFDVTLTWTSLRGAVGYRIYRTTTADGSGEAQWLQDVYGQTSFTDDGTRQTSTDRPHLLPGDLGEWARLDAMGISRASPCLATAPDPHIDPNIVYIYAAGGETSTGMTDVVQYLPVHIESDVLQTTPQPWQWASQTLTTPRSQCGGYSLDYRYHTVVEPGEAWVYFAGGDNGGQVVGEINTGFVLPGGALSQWGEITSFSRKPAGFGAVAASNFLYSFGGANGTPGAKSISGRMDAGGVPDIANWNDLSTNMTESRFLMGAAQESAVIFIIGGETTSAAATRSTEYTNF